MGPNSVRIPAPNPRIPEHTGRSPHGRWVIVTSFPSPLGYLDRPGGRAYWGETRSGYDGLTPYPGNAYRYESENAALYEAYELKQRRRFSDFIIEELPPKPMSSAGVSGTGGRA
jgi:hypothetical protein